MGFESPPPDHASLAQVVEHSVEARGAAVRHRQEALGCVNRYWRSLKPSQGRERIATRASSPKAKGEHAHTIRPEQAV